MSNDLYFFSAHKPRVPETNRQLMFNKALCSRIKTLRTTRTALTAEQMAKALGVEAEAYRKYEYRSPLPHYLLEPFAYIVGCDVEYLITGKSAKRRKASQPDARAIAVAIVTHLDRLPKEPETQRVYLAGILQRELGLPGGEPNVQATPDAQSESEAPKAAPARAPRKKADSGK